MGGGGGADLPRGRVRVPVDRAEVRAEVEVERKGLAAAIDRALERSLAWGRARARAVGGRGRARAG